MADFNDVVRHVILRIIVDQSTLAAEMAAAREKLKALKEAEKATNKERERNNDAVTKGLEKQNKALEENREAHEAAQRASAGKSARSTEGLNAETAGIKQQTKEVEAKTVAEAKAEAIRKKAHQDELDRIKQRSQAAKTAEQELEQAKAKTARAQADASNTRLGGQVNRANQSAESNANISRKDAKSAAQIATEESRERNTRLGGQTARSIQKTAASNTEARKDTAAEEKSQRDLTAFNESERRKDDAHDEGKRHKDEAHNEAERRKDAAADGKLQRDQTAFSEAERRKDDAHTHTETRRDTESAARTATSDARTQGIVDKNTDLDSIRSSTYVDRETAVRETAQSQTQVAQQRSSAATSIADAAAARTANAQSKQASDDAVRAIKEADAADKSSTDRANRRITAQRQIKSLQSDIAKFATQQQILESRLADTVERRARAVEKEFRAAQSRRGLVATAGALVGDVATAGLRAATSAGSGGALRRGLKADVPDVTSQSESFRRLTTTVGRAETAVSQFFRRFTGSDGEKSLSVMGGLRAKVLGVLESLDRPRRGGSGGGLFTDMVNNFGQLGSKLTGALGSARVRLLSFQTLIVAVVAALGPLASVLGGVGAAALGLASNIVSLSGSLLALPGILGALIGGFGALALVMKPITSIFSAYSAAQKEAVQGTRVATNAALDHKIAVLSEEQAELAYNRALADKPRAILKLADARKQAARDIQDYRLQLQKLKFDEEGAALGVESAELAYRKSLVDPTATNLDRRIARHDVEGSLFDKRDQEVAGGRLQEDSKEAFKKGVEGSDAVIEAQRGVEDATYKVRDSYLAWQKAILATQKAAEADKAGGTAAAEFQRQIDKLPPKTKKVVLALIDLKDAYKAMRDRLSENIFGPISGETGKFKDLLKSLEDFLGPVSTSIGKFAKSALDLFSNADWKDFFKEQGVESGYIIEQLGDALLAAADGFRAVVEQARPFTRFIVDGIKGMADSFKDFATSDEGREKISTFLALTRRRMQELWPVIKNLAGGFAGFFAALNTAGGGKEDFTTWFNKGLLTASQTFKKLGDQARDPNSGFQKWLREVRPLLHDIVGFLKGAGKFFGDLFSNPANMQEASKTLQQISQRWLPALAEFFDKLSKSGLVSKLATGISSAFEGINKFFDHGGLSTLSAFATALETAGKVIGGIATVVDYLGDHFAGLDSIIGAIGTTIAFVFGAALIAKISGISGLIKGVIGLVKGVGNVAGSIYDRKPGERGRIRGAIQDGTDSAKDSVLGRNTGESTARRNARNQAKQDAADGKPDRRNNARPGSKPSTTPKTPEIDRTGTGGVLPHLSRIEQLLQKIVINTRGGGSGGSAGSGGSGGGGNPTGGGGSGSGGKQSSAQRRNGVVVPDLDGAEAGFGTVGSSVVTDGVDPNSAEGKKQRLEAAKQAKADRLSRGSTPLGRLEREVGSYTPAKTTTFKSSLKNLFGKTTSGLGKGSKGLGKGLLAGLSVFAGAQPALGELQDVALPPRTPTYTPAGQSSTFSPYDFDATKPEQTVARPPRQRGPKGQYLPNPPQQYAFDPYTDADLTTSGVTKKSKQVRPGLEDDYSVAKPPRPRGPKGQFLPAPAPQQATYNPYTDYDLNPVGLDDDYTVDKPPRQRDAKGRLLPKTAPQQYDFDPIDIDTPAVKKPGVFKRAGSGLKNLGKRFGSVLGNDAGYIELGRDGDDDSSSRRTSSRRARTPGAPSLGGAPDLDVLSDIINGGDGSGTQASPQKKGFFRKVFGRNDAAAPTRRDKAARPAKSKRFGRGARGAAVSGIADAVLGGDEYEEGYEDGLAADGDGLDLPDTDRDGKDKGTGRRGRSTTVEGDVVDEDEPTRRGRRGTVDTNEPSRGRRGTVIDGEATETSRSRPSRRRGGRGGRAGGRGGLGRSLGRGLGGKLGGLARGLGGGLLRGAAGGIGGLVAGAAASLGGDYLINKFVKNDDDASSLQRGMGAVANGAGIGASIGSIIPGVGTVIGGAVGGLAGGAYSLFKDKNLRSFVGDKLGGAAKGVGGFLKGAGGALGGALGGLFGGKKDDDEAPPGGASGQIGGKKEGGLKGLLGGLAGGGIAGALLGKTDIGKSILDSLKKAGKGIGDFFTKDIPNFFKRGVKGITDFFTKTLPSLPGKAFDAITTGFGVLLGFFKYDVPRAASAAWDGIKNFFTKTLPAVASAAWDGIKKFFTETLPAAASAAWDGIKNFFTETLPNAASTAWDNIKNFFTETLPKVAKQAWDGITNFFTTTLPNVLTTLWDNISNFFGTTLPNFFTVTLPDAIKKLPGFLMDHLVKPIVDFFTGIGDHIGDALKGGWNAVKGWASSLWDRAGSNVQAGEDTRKHMSGGLIEGVYQGIQDTAKVLATPGEFMVRKSKVDEPGAKAFLRDFNENGMASLYSGLSASTRPQVMSMVPPDAQTLTGKVPAVVNNTVNHAPVMGDVTINNPVRERSEHSLRRQVQIAAIRHRR